MLIWPPLISWLLIILLISLNRTSLCLRSGSGALSVADVCLFVHSFVCRQHNTDLYMRTESTTCSYTSALWRNSDVWQLTVSTSGAIHLLINKSVLLGNEWNYHTWSVMIDRLGTGWSMHTSETGSLTRSAQLTYEEQEHIMHVIRQAELLEHTEMQRIGLDTGFSSLVTSETCWLLQFCLKLFSDEIQQWNVVICYWFMLVILYSALLGSYSNWWEHRVWD